MARKRKKYGRRRRSQGNLGGVGAWCEEHPVMTFLLATGAISMAFVGVSKLTTKK